MFFDLLSTLLIGPLKLVFEIIYMVANRFIDHPGLSIIFLSLVMNILVLPLYRRADAMQEAARDIDAKLHDGVAHIKKTFSGDERMMILQTYYRQNNYRPTDALNGSVSLLLEIPFFMAAYQFLSALTLLEGVSLGPIADLSAPDALIAIGGMHINLLPILMTLINIISSFIYLKGFPLKTKIQLYGMALFFLIFLYTSPSGLVFYWTLNNLFSLIKTIFYKLKNPRRVLSILCSVAGACLLGFALLGGMSSFKMRSMLALISFALEFPLLVPLFARIVPCKKTLEFPQANSRIFFLCCLFLTLFIGVLIPSTYIAASPQEFVDIYSFHNPLWYIAYSFFLAAGFFLIWMRVFYWLANNRAKAIFDILMFILCGAVVINYMFFGTDLGIISANLQYETDLHFSSIEQIINLFVLGCAAFVSYVIFRRFSRLLPAAMLVLVIALGGMSVLNIHEIRNPVALAKIRAEEAANNFPEITLSRTGKNVVVIMLDRALGYIVPYLMEEKPELYDQFAGFTHYNNTVSFGKHTVFGVAPLAGGYEYTPVEMNKRSSELLREKHNEALKVMPVTFLEAGYDVTVCDPPYANYNYISDLSIFEDYPQIKRYITSGRFGQEEQKASLVEGLRRNFFCFSLMKSSPLMLQGVLYNDGWYNRADLSLDERSSWGQTRYNLKFASGIDNEFLNAYSVLLNLPTITNIVEENQGSYLFLANDTTHSPTLLQKPDYVPKTIVDNTVYDAQDDTERTLNGRTLLLETDEQVIHYHVNMAAFLQLGNWFDYLRENGVYDNTRIVLTSDHGRFTCHLDEISPGGKKYFPVMGDSFFPLLMVKDFGATTYSVSDEFMTNADVPMLAMEGVIPDAKNPFTGNPINNDEKYAHEQYIILSSAMNAETQTGNTYLASDWASVRDDVWNPDNWLVHPDNIVLKEHSFKSPSSNQNE